MESCTKAHAKKVASSLLLALLFFFPQISQAAMLSVFPATGSYTEGKTFSVTVRASSYSVPLNAISGTLSYPADLLSVVSVSKSGSVLTNWLPPGADGPIYTPGSGSIRFEGISLSGYQGAPRTVFTVTFRVKKEGVATVKFSNGLILANDGEGSDITYALGSASYMLLPAPIELEKPKEVAPPEPKPVEPAPTETAPVVPEPEVSTPSPVEPTPEKAPRFSFVTLLSDPYVFYGGSAFLILIICIILLAIRVHQLSKKIQRLEAGRRSLKKKFASKTKSSDTIPF